jgi:hypothetical protein
VVHQADIRLINHNVGSLHLDPMQIKGEDGPFMPALIVPVELDLHKPDDKMLVVERLEATLWTQPAEGPRVRVGLPAAIEWAGRGDTRPLHSLPRGQSHHVELRFELLEGGLRRLDEHAQRSAQGPILLSLYFEARVGLGSTSVADGLPSVSGLEVWTVRRFWGPTVEELQIQLPRERWVEQIAPALGHDRVRLINVAMPSANGPLGDESAAMFDAASRAYDAADWRETIQKCRDVRNYVEQHARHEPDERLSKVVAGRVGADETDARIRFLDNVWVALADVTSDAHHVRSIGRLDAATAHATLLLTATMIQYVNELLSPV